MKKFLLPPLFLCIVLAAIYFFVSELFAFFLALAAFLYVAVLAGRMAEAIDDASTPVKEAHELIKRVIENDYNNRSTE